MVVIKGFLQISCLYCLVDELSSLKIGLRLEDSEQKFKSSYKIERFKLRHELATFDHLDVKNIVHERQQKSELRDDKFKLFQDER